MPTILGAHRDTLIIDDAYVQKFAEPHVEGGYGLIPRDWDKQEYGSVEFAGPVALPLIPRSEWADRIRDSERTKSRLSDIIDDVNNGPVPCLDQNGYGYCHAFSLAHAAMCLRATMNLPFKLLSASSIAGPVTGYRNKGAWIMDDLKQITTHGIADSVFYPMTTTKNSWTPEGENSASENKVVEWWELKRRDFDEVMTCLFSVMPVPVGINKWGHSVNYLDPIMVDGVFGVLFQNSWKASWGKTGNGRAILLEHGSGYSAVPDEAYAPRQMSIAA